ncbi:MAG: YidC/Oxa1 family membrane protein insertase, partial [Lachnospiraceae bacterium]|nr:YidC/Oxa1 family membrane protein insertase [Lachnospiraceae bacterium]
MGTVLYNIIISPIEMIFEMIFGITYGVVFSYGTDIVILSLVVNFLVLPLYRQADILQKDAVDKEKKLEKWKKHINKYFKSDERYMILSAYYKEAEYSPIHQLSASLPLLIQIPFFIAAYHFLS